MAVPASGILTMKGIAQERLYGTYGSGTITGAIVMTDLISGGNSGGSGNSYPSLNTNSPSKPNTTTPHAMNEWYSYDQDYSALTTFYLTTNSAKNFGCFASPIYEAEHDGSSSLPIVNDTVYTTSGSAYASGSYGMATGSGGFVGARIIVGSGGVVSAKFNCIF